MLKEKIKNVFGAEIVEKDGIRTLQYLHEQYYWTRVQKLPEGKYTVTIDNNAPSRTRTQNNFLWGVVYPTICEETGNEIDDLHEWGKRKFLKPRTITVSGENIKIPGSTAKLSKSDFAGYIARLEEWSGVAIPNPCEVGYFCGKPQCNICTQKL